MMLADILQCTEQPLTTKAQNVSSVEQPRVTNTSEGWLYVFLFTVDGACLFATLSLKNGQV